MTAQALRSTSDWNLSAFDKASTRVEGATPSELRSVGANESEAESEPVRPVASIVQNTTSPIEQDGVEITAAEPKRSIKPAMIEAVGNLSLNRELSKINRGIEFEIIERWQGVVDEIRGAVFSARLASSANSAAEPHEAGEFSVWRLSNDDKTLLEVGAYFTYVVAREVRRGAPQTFSKITFRRMPFWHLREVAAAKVEGKRISDYLKERAAQRDGDIEPTSFDR